MVAKSGAQGKRFWIPRLTLSILKCPFKRKVKVSSKFQKSYFQIYFMTPFKTTSSERLWRNVRFQCVANKFNDYFYILGKIS